MTPSHSSSGSSLRLAQYSAFYFVSYALYGVLVKICQGPTAKGLIGLSETQFLVYSSFGSSFVCLSVILARSWWKTRWTKRELIYIALSGTFTALVIPTTNMMYLLPISIMVAMVIMRGSIIVVSRLIDTVLIAQGISRKQVPWEENIAVVFALSAVGANLLFAQEKDFQFLKSAPALTILGVYIFAYTLRIYFMNYFKFTREREGAADKRNYFAVEQLTAFIWIYGLLGTAVIWPGLFPGASDLARSFSEPHPKWVWATMAGMPFGFSAFFSAFLFLFEGRTSTFSGLANRLSSLLAGTISTLFFALFFGGGWPKPIDWLSFALLLVAVSLLWKAETKKLSAS